MLKTCKTEIVYFKVLEVNRYRSRFVFVKTNFPEGNIFNRFFVEDSDLWEVGNSIKRTCRPVDHKVPQPNTSYTEWMGVLYEIKYEECL